jgi:hypothetical protein
MAGVMVRDVPMRVLDARRPSAESGAGDTPGVVLLGEVGGSRQLAIWLDPLEATWIALALEGVHPPRPRHVPVHGRPAPGSRQYAA